MALVPVINSCSILLMTTAIYAVIGDIVPVAYRRIPANELLCMCAHTFAHSWGLEKQRRIFSKTSLKTILGPSASQLSP
jgi:hypothetical protein